MSQYQKGRMDLAKELQKSLMEGKLREEFENIFEKDPEASRGERPSNSNRSGALVYHADIMNEITRLSQKKLPYEELLKLAPPHDSDEFLTFLEENNEVVYSTGDWLIVKNYKYHTEEKPWLTAFSTLIPFDGDIQSLCASFSDWKWIKKHPKDQTVKRFHIHLTK